jgi:hypothetical protein
LMGHREPFAHRITVRCPGTIFPVIAHHQGGSKGTGSPQSRRNSKLRATLSSRYPRGGAKLTKRFGDAVVV